MRADRRRILGADHPNTLMARHNLAGSLHIAGRRDDAVALHRETPERARAVLPPIHELLPLARQLLQELADV